MPEKIFNYSTNEKLKLLIIRNVYNKFVQYICNFNIFNFKMFCKGY